MTAGNTPFNVSLAGSFYHVEGYHRVVVHDNGVVGLDETHATHVSCQVEHMVAFLAHALAVIEHA